MSEKTQYTPGPWAWSGAQLLAERDRHSETVLIAAQFEPSDADARLIAAAPEMFEALKHALSTMENVDGENDCSKSIAVVEAALSKAGEAR